MDDKRKYARCLKDVIIDFKLINFPDEYLMGMRVYEGHNEVVDCHWFPPALTLAGQ